MKLLRFWLLAKLLDFIPVAVQFHYIIETILLYLINLKPICGMINLF